MESQKQHWEQVYENKAFENVSWYQTIPQTSIDFLKQTNLPAHAKIIDVGGGESRLIDYLLQEGYIDTTVLDISEKAIQKKQTSLGGQASQVKWIVADIANFLPTKKYDFWHDRATFHFLTTQQDIDNYVNVIHQFVQNKGFLMIATFAKDGPEKCSGLPITQYNEADLVGKFQGFELVSCLHTSHTTPFDTTQNFVFCLFQKK